MQAHKNPFEKKIIHVIVPNSLRKYTDGRSEIECNASDLKGLIGEINQHYPGFQDRLCDTNGEIKSYFNVYIDGEDSRYLNGMRSPLERDSEVVIVAAVAGGQSEPMNTSVI